MKLRNAMLGVLFGAVLVFSIACPGGGGGTSAGMMAAVPDGDYTTMMTMKPNEFLNAEFITNLKTNFPMSQMMFSEFETKANESGMELEKIDTVMMVGKQQDSLVFVKGTFTPEDAIASYEENEGIELEEKDISGVKVYHNAAADKGLLFNNQLAIQGDEATLTKVVGVLAGTEKKFVDGELFAKFGKYIDANATVSFVVGDKGAFDPTGFANNMAASGMTEEETAKLTEAAEKMEGLAGKVYMSNAIKVDLAMVFADADAAKVMADFANSKKDEAFTQAADQLEQMAEMMPNINADRDKFMALANKINFGTDGNAMMVKMDIAWGDIAFFFAK